MKFDIDAARKEGYSDEEIADYLASKRNFDLSGALESGYSVREVIDHLNKPAPEAPAVSSVDASSGQRQSASATDRTDQRPVTATQPSSRATAPAARSHAAVDSAAAIDYSDAATAMQGSAPPSTQTPPEQSRGLIQRVADVLRPRPVSVLEGYQPTPQRSQAEIDRRLSYGAGPISRETAAAADAVRSGTARTTDPTVKKVARAMDAQGAPSLADLTARARSPENQRAAREAKANEFRTAGEWAVDTLSSLAQGAVGLVQLPVNIIAPGSGTAKILRETQKELQGAESEVLQANRERLRERVLSEDGFFDKYVATVKELVINPTLTISEAAKQLPNFLGVVGAARLAGAGAAGTVAAAGRASPTVALGEAISGGAMQAAARAAGTTAGGAGASMVMAGGDAAGNVYETLTDRKKTPLSVWKQNPDFQRLVSEGKSEKQAIEELATTKARMAALITAPLGLLGYMGAEAAVASRGLGRATAQALTPSGMARTAAKDVLGEQLEEGGTQAGGNLVAQTVNPNQSITEGVPEAMGTALVTSAPFTAAGLVSQYQEATRQADADLAAERNAAYVLDPNNYDPALMAPTAATRRASDVGPAAPARVVNFTEPDSATAQAGLTPIVVPVPTRQETTDVGTAGTAGPAIAGGGQPSGDLDGTSLGTAGFAGVDALRGDSPGSAGLAPVGGEAAPLGAGAGQQPTAVGLPRPLARATDADLLARTEAAVAAQENNNDVVQPSEQWFGRKGDGYVTSADAQQALPGRQRMYPQLDWKVEQMPSGKFRLAGYSQETTLGTQATQAQQAEAQGQSIVGAQGSGVGLPLAAGGVEAANNGVAIGQRDLAVRPGAGPAEVGALTTPEGAQTAGLTQPLRLAAPVPLRRAGDAIVKFNRDTGLNIELSREPMTPQQQAGSAIARLLGLNLAVVKGDPGALPNGFVIPDIGKKDVYVAADADDAPLGVVIHEGYHLLPDDLKAKVKGAVGNIFREEKRDQFAAQFNYDKNNKDLVDEEIGAFLSQAVGRRQDFLEKLQQQLGDKDFIAVIGTILGKLKEVVTGAKEEYGESFLNEYVKDIPAAVDLLSGVYAEAMNRQGQGQQAGGLAASNRSRIDMDFKDVIKRTPELQAGMAKLQAGEITKEDYDRLVNEYKPVEPYKSVPAPVTPEAARFALANGRGQSEEKAAKLGLPSQEMRAGEPTQLRLDIPSYSEHGAWVVSVHRPEGRSFGAGKVVGYEPVASVKNAEFGMLEKSAAKIAAGANKGTIATIMGDWKPTTAAEAKLKADQALKSKEWVQVGMDPERHSYFYDRATMEPVTAADEVIQIGPLVLAKNPTYGKKSDFMFSNRAQEPAIGASLRERIDSDYDGAVQEYSQLKGAKNGRVLDADIARELSPEYRADRSRAPEVHEAVSDFVQRTFEQRMAEPGRGDIVAFMAGGGGAGKSSAEELLAPILDRATTVVDGTLSTYDKAERNVQMALDSGRRVAIAYVYRDPVDALVNGVLTRAKRTGRAVPIDALVKGHAGSSSVVRKLQEKFGGNRNFKLHVIDNSRGQNNAKRVKSIEKITPVIIDGLKERLINATEKQFQAGQIDDKLYRATVGRQADAGAGAQGAARVGEIQQGSGVDTGQGRQPDESRDQVIQYSKRAGQYTYQVDNKKRLIVSGDIDRIRFVARSVATGALNADKNAVVFKPADASAVIKALKNEQKANPEIAKAIAAQLALNDEELNSTSLEFQTGEPGERAFSAPLQGGIPETVQFLEGRRRSSGLRLLDISNPEDQDTLAKLIAAETMAAIRSSGNALEWYDETIAKTLAMAAVKYPELISDRNAQMVFRLAMAITSQGLNVENNLKFTMRQYDAFRSSSSNPADRRFPEVGEGDSSQAMVGNFKLANELLADMGPDLFRRFLVTEFTIGELNSAGFEPGGELVDERVLGSSVFGPKIGFGFYSNLNGNFEPVTMDMWFMRTIGRLTGNLRSFDAEKFSGQLQRFRDSFDKRGADGVYADQFDADLVGRASTSEDSAIELARQVKKAHEKDYKANREAFDNKERKKTNLVLAAETMIQSVDKPKDVPGNGTERRQLREVVRKAVAEVERVYGQRIPPAAMQALIWYPEQELYKALGVKLSVTSQDYAGATEKVLTQEGYDAKRLRTAAQSGARRVRQANGRDVGRGAQGDGQEARRAGPLQDTEREQFIRSRYERAQLEQERLTPKRKGVIFEVAPDPNNTELTTRWRNLSQEQRLAVSDRIAQEIVPKVLAQMGTSGIIVSQVGSYLDDTNPSFEVLLDKGNALEVAKALGFILSQDSMMVISPKKFDGGDEVGAISIEIGDKSQSEVDAIYQSLREIEVKGEKPIGGQSTANGVMTILNYSTVPTQQLAILVDQKLNKGYSILTREVFAAFPEKQEYDYASEANDGRGSRANLRRGARALRSEATTALERELAGISIRRSNRLAEPARGPGARANAANDGQNVTGIHYGKAPGLSRLSGTQFGSGIKGAEQARLNEPGVDPRIKKRVYFYLTSNNADMPRPEIGLGSYVYRATLGNMYDPTKASAGAAKRVRDLMQGSGANAFESAVLDAGYRGYVNREQGTAVVLNADVPVAYEGQADAGKMRDRVIERIAPKSASRQEGDELVRRPVGDELMGIIKARPALVEAAPSFRLEFGEARVKQTEAEAADAALADAGSSFQFGKQDADSPFTVMRSNRVKMAPIEEPGDFDAKPGDEITVVRLASMAGLDNTNAASVKGLYTYLSMVDDNESAAGSEAQGSDTIFVYKVKVPDGGFSEYSMQRGGKSVAGGAASETVGRQKAKYGGYWYSFPQGTQADLIGSLPLTVARDTLMRVSREKDESRYATQLAEYNAGTMAFSPSPLNSGSNNFDYVGTDVGSKALAVALQDAGFDMAPGGVVYSNRVRLADDAPAQERFLQRKAEEAGYANVDEFVDQDYEGFVEAAAQWRQENPAEVMFSQRSGDGKPDAEVVNLFKDLQSSRGLKAVRTKERVAEHPMGDQIAKIHKDFYDILERLEDGGLIKINCK